MSEPIDRSRFDPYLTGKAPEWWNHPHRPPDMRLCAVGAGIAPGTWKAAMYKTRAIVRGEILALFATGDAAAKAGSTIVDPVALGFIEAIEGGMMVERDVMLIEGKVAGDVAAFEDTAFPNHLAVIIRPPQDSGGGDARPGGIERGLKIGDRVTFEARFTPYT